MLTSSHALLEYRLRSAGPWRGWFVLGAVAPDLPAFAGVTARVVHGDRRGRAVIANVYERGPWRPVLLGTHSVFGWAALMAVAARGSAPRALATGALSHLAVDVLSHHDDAWPVFWPCSDRRWQSPVSYWQLDHHACSWAMAEMAAILITGPSTTSSTDRWWTRLCLAMTALPMIRALREAARRRRVTGAR